MEKIPNNSNEIVLNIAVCNFLAASTAPYSLTPEITDVDRTSDLVQESWPINQQNSFTELCKFNFPTSLSWSYILEAKINTRSGRAVLANEITRFYCAAI